MILVLIEKSSQLEPFQNQLKQRSNLNAENICLVASTPELQAKLESLGYTSKSPRDFDTQDYDQGVSRAAYQFGEEWYQQSFAQSLHLNFHSIPVAKLIEREATYVFLWILRTISFVQKALDEIKPQEIWASTELEESLFFHGGLETSLYGPIAIEEAKKRSLKTTSLNGSKNKFLPIKKILLKIPGYRFREVLLRATSIDFIKYSKALAQDFISWVASFLHDSFAKSKKAGEKNILISSSLSHVREVIESLKKESFPLVYLREVFSLRQARQLNKEGIFFSTLRSTKANAEAKQVSKNWQHSWIMQENALLDESYFTFRDFKFGKFLKPRFDYLFTEYFPKLAALIVEFEAHLKKHSILKIVLDEDICTFNKTLVHVANQMKIPSLVVQHGLTGMRVAFAPLSATRFAAWGPFSRRRLMEWGVEEGRIIVTGRALKQETKKGLPNRETFYHEMKLDPNKPTILLAMTPYRDYSMSDFPEVESYPEIFEKILLTAAQATLSIEGAQLIVKCHPREQNLDRCFKILEHCDLSRVAIKKEHPALWYIQHTDCLLTVISSIITDALPTKKPMIILDPSKNTAQTQEVLALKAPIVGIDTSTIADQIKNALKHKNTDLQNEFIEDHLFQLDGQAAQRITDAVLNL